MRIDTDRYWVYNSSVNLIKVNKLVYVASRAYQFGQQYAIISMKSVIRCVKSVKCSEILVIAGSLISSRHPIVVNY